MPKSGRMTEAGEAGERILTFIKALPYIFAQPGLLYLSFLSLWKSPSNTSSKNLNLSGELSVFLQENMDDKVLK